MTNINVSLPQQMRDWVEAQIKAGRYGNLSEYVRDLIRRDQKMAAEEHLESLLLAGLDSLDAGKGSELTPADWERLRQGVIRRHAEGACRTRRLHR